MTALIARSTDSPRARVAMDVAHASLLRQGFPPPKHWTAGDVELRWYPSPGRTSQPPCWLDMPGQGLAASVGTVFFRGRTGVEALAAIWTAFTTPDGLSEHEIHGNYLLAIAKDNRLWLFGDRLGMAKLYRADDVGVLSTSWLACLDAGNARLIDRVGALDYVFNGANHGLRTPAQGVSLADPTLAYELLGARTRPLTQPQDWIPPTLATDHDASLARSRELIRGRARDLAEGFPGQVRSALSGGFDSRLVVAALESVGCIPALHVYGPPDDEDVVIARHIADRLDLPLHHRDKVALNATLPRLTEPLVLENLHFFDGLPLDGVFDRGADRLTREAQVSDGALSLNGGGGEILRNFFYLGDGTFSARELVETFYRGFHPSAVRHRSDIAEYTGHLTGEIERAVGLTGRLPRPVVELVYSLFRNRFWTSRNNAMAARIGHFVTPLLDVPLVKLAASLPLAWKNHGRFEAELLASLSPRLASFPLSYGFTPADGPTLGYRLTMGLQYRRPPWLRARSVRIKAALGRLHTATPSAEVLECLPRPWAIEALLDTQYVFDRGQLLRALTLEALVRFGYLRIA